MLGNQWATRSVGVLGAGGGSLHVTCTSSISDQFSQTRNGDDHENRTVREYKVVAQRKQAGRFRVGSLEEQGVAFDELRKSQKAERAG